MATTNLESAVPLGAAAGVVSDRAGWPRHGDEGGPLFYSPDAGEDGAPLTAVMPPPDADGWGKVRWRRVNESVELEQRRHVRQVGETLLRPVLTLSWSILSAVDVDLLSAIIRRPTFFAAGRTPKAVADDGPPLALIEWQGVSELVATKAPYSSGYEVSIEVEGVEAIPEGATRVLDALFDLFACPFMPADDTPWDVFQTFLSRLDAYSDLSHEYFGSVDVVYAAQALRWEDVYVDVPSPLGGTYRIRTTRLVPFVVGQERYDETPPLVAGEARHVRLLLDEDLVIIFVDGEPLTDDDGEPYLDI